MQLRLKSMFILLVILNTFTNAKSIAENQVEFQCGDHKFLRESASANNNIVLSSSNKYLNLYLRPKPMKTDETKVWTVFYSDSASGVRMFGIKNGNTYELLTFRNEKLQLVKENDPSFETCNSTFQLKENRLKLYDTKKFIFCLKGNIEKSCSHSRDAFEVKIKQ